MKNYSNSELFSLANNLRKEFNLTQKEAFAKAKAQLEANVTESNDVEQLNKYNKLHALMLVGNVKFSFINKHNKTITTTGTLLSSHIPTGKREIQGRKTPKSDEYEVFYDIRHGVFRSFNKLKIVDIY